MEQQERRAVAGRHGIRYGRPVDRDGAPMGCCRGAARRDARCDEEGRRNERSANPAPNA
jgi:hypothetical protein